MNHTIGSNFYLNLQRVEQQERIPLGAFHSLDEGETLVPIVNPETIGDIPANFSSQRSFWKLITIIPSRLCD